MSLAWNSRTRRLPGSVNQRLPLPSKVRLAVKPVGDMPWALHRAGVVSGFRGETPLADDLIRDGVLAGLREWLGIAQDAMLPL